MRNLVKIILILLLATTSALSQPKHPGDRAQAMQRIHAFKIAYITDKLQLTEQQSGSFIPLYKEYENEIQETRQSFFKKYKNSGAPWGEADDAASRQYIDDNLDYQQQVIEIKRKYKDRFLKVLSPGQYAQLPAAEREVRLILLKQLDKQRGNGRFNRRNGN